MWCVNLMKRMWNKEKEKSTGKEFNIKRSENDKKCGYQTLIFLYCHVYGRKLPVADSADAE